MLNKKRKIVFKMNTQIKAYFSQFKAKKLEI
jgi:hypothetical protein